MIIHFSFIFLKLLFWWILSFDAAPQPARDIAGRDFMDNISICFLYRLNFLLTFSSTKYLVYPSILVYLHVSISLTSSPIWIFFFLWSLIKPVSKIFKYLPGKSPTKESIIEDLWTCVGGIELWVILFFFKRIYGFDSFEYYTVRFDYVHPHNCSPIHPFLATQVLSPSTS